ncbi:SDR family oxidoreductase [Paraburkholderia sediminicola]|uniref:SDR family oxidoreductase n=1 Tax=Paraburkholderia metrosideri TaxID=580937 RepID=A0ABW9DTY3_9BURK
MKSSALFGKAALLTAACQGIGTKVAAALAAQGARVVLHALPGSASDSVRAAVVAIRNAGGQAQVLHADLNSLPAIAALFDAAEQTLGGIDIVVSNAPDAPLFHSIVDTDLADYDAVTTRNAKTRFFVLQQAGRRVRDDGCIVATSSGESSALQAGSAVYAGASAAAELYCRVLAKEIGARGVTVNVVTANSGGVTADTPQEVADVIAFLASHDARWITGQNIRAGFTLAG